jgi:hypothetical protein
MPSRTPRSAAGSKPPDGASVERFPRPPRAYCQQGGEDGDDGDDSTVSAGLRSNYFGDGDDEDADSDGSVDADRTLVQRRRAERRAKRGGN